MNKGGIIVSHDYRTIDAVRQAFDEFFKDLPEIVIPAMGTTCVVSKT